MDTNAASFESALSDLTALPADEVALAAKIEVCFLTFVEKVRAMTEEHTRKNFSNLTPEVVRVDDGRRYWRVVRGTSAYCFVDKTNGAVLKCASWKAPAKHARGNVMDADYGLGSVGPYGANYLR